MIPSSNDLLTFLAVADTRSFTAAAEQRGLTKSAVSQTLSRLEDIVGAKLLFRTTRSLSLTETGARLLPVCRSLHQVQAEIQATLAETAAKGPESLTITAPHALCAGLLVPVLAELMQPSQLRIRMIAEDAPIDLVRHRIDLAIRVGGSAPQAARISRIGFLKESLYAADQLVARMGGIPKEIEALKSWPHIANDWQGDPVTYKTADNAVLRVTPALRSNNVLGVKAFVSAGSGVGLLPDLLVQRDDRLVPILAILKTPIYALHQHGQTPPKPIKTIVTALRTALRTMIA